MPVSTRSNQKRWPPRADEVSTDGSIIVGSGDELTLPPDLYWQYVQPYIPLNYRPILNKRSGSTQFYAGERVDIDTAFLSKANNVLVWTGIPTVTGTPGMSDFRIHVDEYSENQRFDPTINEEETLTALQNVRDLWDEHMHKITSPSARLHACLSLFGEGQHPNLPVELPLLFPGDGTAEDVVKFHVSMNQMSVNGTIKVVSTSTTTPTLLQYWIDKYLGWCYSDMMDGAHYSITSQMEWVVRALFNEGGDLLSVASFYKPLYSPPNEFYAWNFSHIPRMNTIDYMKRYIQWMWDNDDGSGMNIGGLGWVIHELEAHEKKSRESILSMRKTFVR